MAFYYAHSEDFLFSTEMHSLFTAHFYEKVAYQGKYVALGTDNCSGFIQRTLNIDAVLQRERGKSWCIEEKYERHHSKNYTFALETQAPTGKPGWMYYSKADFLLYGFRFSATEMDTFFIHFPKLKEWFFKNQERYPNKYLSNGTIFRSVSIEDVCEAVKPLHMVIIANGAIKRGYERKTVGTYRWGA